jgi:ATP-dependent DNA ligase
VSPFNKRNLESVFDEYIEAGFEGMMPRSIDSAYKFGRRSGYTPSLKYKKTNGRPLSSRL